MVGVKREEIRGELETTSRYNYFAEFCCKRKDKNGGWGYSKLQGKVGSRDEFFFMMRECLYGTGEKAESDNAGE